MQQLFAGVANKGYVVRPTDADPGEVLGRGPSWVPSRLADGATPWTWGVVTAERTARFMLRSLRTTMREQPGSPELPRAVAGLSAVGGLVAEAAQVFTAARRLPTGRVVRDALVVEVLTRTFAGDEPFQRTPSSEFLRLGPDVDSPLFARCYPGRLGLRTALIRLAAWRRRRRLWRWLGAPTP